MSNEPIKPIEQNYVPLEELFPNLVVGGVEVDDNISSVTKTWSSSKINTEIDSVSSSVDLSPYQLTSAKNTAGGYTGLNSLGFVDLSRLSETTKDYVETFIDTDFYDANISSYSMALPWTISDSGGTSSFRLATTDGNLNLSTSTSSVNYIGYSKPNLFVLSSTDNYEFWLQYGFKIDTLSDGTNRYEIVLGSESNNLIANNTNRMSIRYSDNSNGGKFEIITKLAGVQTNTDTGVTVAINTNYDIKFKVTSSGLTVYINDVALPLITSNVPYDVILKSGFMIRKSIGNTARLLRMNYRKSYRINTTAKRY